MYIPRMKGIEWLILHVLQKTVRNLHMCPLFNHQKQQLGMVKNLIISEDSPNQYTPCMKWIKWSVLQIIRLEGPEDPHRTNSRFLRSRDPAHASLPLAQTPWGLTRRAWLQAGAQQVAIVVSHR